MRMWAEYDFDDKVYVYISELSAIRATVCWGQENSKINVK